jgi:transcriptional repressor of cell division inhibition gene dicB
MCGMQKTEAIDLLGGSVAAAAKEIGCSYQAVDKWPDTLPPRILDRVQAALYRRQQSDQPPHPAAQGA